jgi:hypothetical protein
MKTMKHLFVDSVHRFVMLVSACVPAETPAPAQPAATEAQLAATEAQPSTGEVKVIKVGALYPPTGVMLERWRSYIGPTSWRSTRSTRRGIKCMDAPTER